MSPFGNISEIYRDYNYLADIEQQKRQASLGARRNVERENVNAYQQYIKNLSPGISEFESRYGAASKMPSGYLSQRFGAFNPQQLPEEYKPAFEAATGDEQYQGPMAFSNIANVARGGFGAVSAAQQGLQKYKAQIFSRPKKKYNLATNTWE
jgi:hypothetical protein